MVMCHLQNKKLLLEITALRRIFPSKKERMEDNCIVSTFTFCPLHEIFFVSIPDGTDDFGDPDRS
jgi:hypothetical protein